MIRTVTVDPADPSVDHHRYGGNRIVSAASQINLLVEAVATGDRVIRHKSVSFSRPIEVHDRLQLRTSQDGDRLALVDDEVVVAQSKFSTFPAMTQIGRAVRFDGAVLDMTRSFRKWKQQECPMEYGPFYDVIRHLEMTEEFEKRFAVALVDERVPPTNSQRCPVAYIDAGLQVLAYIGGQGGGGLPWQVECVSSYRAGRGPARVVVAPVHGTGRGVIRGDITVETMQGELMISMEGVTLRAPRTLEVARGRHQEQSDRICVRRWVPLDLVEELSPASREEAVILRPRSSVDPAKDLEDFIGQFTSALARRPNALRVITQGGRATSAGAMLNPFSAAVGALLGPARLEYPRVSIQWLDTDDEQALKSAPEAGRVPEAAWTGQEWAAPVNEGTLIPARSPDLGGRWLIIGGLGGVMRALLRSLPEFGCASLTLLSRKDPDHQDRQYLADAVPGLKIEFVKADISAPGFVWPSQDEPYEVVVNAAGILEDRLLGGTQIGQIRRVFGPKVGATVPLSAYCLAHSATTVIVFSSTGTEQGRMGQGIYASANAYQDAVAHNRRNEGKPWFTLRWGLWELGMGEQIHTQAAAAGYPVINASQGARLFRKALRTGPGEYWLDGTTMTSEPALPKGNADYNGRTPGDTTMTVETSSIDTLGTVREALTKVLERDSVLPDDSPEDLGLDSMMAVEISAYLADRGLDLDAADAFGHATVADLATHVGKLSTPPAQPTSRTWPSPAAEITVPAREISDLLTSETASTLEQPTITHPGIWPRADYTALRASETRTLAPTRQTVGRTLPSTLTPLTENGPLDARINEISLDDRALIARGEYFYEPVVQESRGSHIRIDGQWKLNFASYSYLGLIGNEFINRRAAAAISKFGTAAHGVRLLAGTATIHRQLENRIANFIGHEEAVVFSSGYMANVATIAALMTKGDVVIGDSLNHASIVDGCILSGAEFRSYAHNDVNALRRELERARGRRTLVVTDAVFSMDGDVLDLPAISHVCKEHNAALMVDEAHSIGVLGHTGRGIAEHYGMDPTSIDVAMGTLSKTIPSAGGYVAGSDDLIFALKNAARGWMFSAAITPAQAAAADAAIELVSSAPELPQKLRTHTEQYRNALNAAGLDTMNSTSPVVPVRCRTAEQALQLAQRCQVEGLFVQPITYPTVPKATPRLRTIVNLTHTDDDLRMGAEIIASSARAIGLL